MRLSPATRNLLRGGVFITLAFIYIPLFIIGLYAFNENITQGWPISGYTTAWFGEAWRDENVRDAFWLSVKCSIAAIIAGVNARYWDSPLSASAAGCMYLRT